MKSKKSIKINNESLASDYFDEAVRFYNNAKDILKDVKIVYKSYQDTKPVVKACGVGYIGMLKACDGYLISRGIDKAKLPTSYQGYWQVLSKDLSHNGKVKSALKVAYENLHIFGYYRGGTGVSMIKEGFQCAKFVIEHLSHKKIPKRGS
ncbi:MAG: DUF5618 family protein [bacterium]